jgi:hypothetical protein
MWCFSHVGQLRTATYSNEYKETDLRVQAPLQPLQNLY